MLKNKLITEMPDKPLLVIYSDELTEEISKIVLNGGQFTVTDYPDIMKLVATLPEELKPRFEHFQSGMVFDLEHDGLMLVDNRSMTAVALHSDKVHSDYIKNKLDEIQKRIKTGSPEDRIEAAQELIKLLDGKTDFKVNMHIPIVRDDRSIN